MNIYQNALSFNWSTNKNHILWKHCNMITAKSYYYWIIIPSFNSVQVETRLRTFIEEAISIKQL